VRIRSVSDQWTIDFFEDDHGKKPVEDFLKDPSLKQGELKQLQTRLQLVEMKGLALLRERSDILEKIDENLYAIRLDNTPNNPRFFLCAITGKILVLLHAFKKKNDDATPQREIDIAAKRRDKEVAKRATKIPEGEKGLEGKKR
jgi:phage-related protein